MSKPRNLRTGPGKIISGSAKEDRDDDGPPLWRVDTPEDLERLADELAEAPRVAVDTEFKREKTYYPWLCVLQVATDDLVACIDPLALTGRPASDRAATIDALEPMFEVFAMRDIEFVLHSAKQDLEILLQCMDELPVRVFDTQIAATHVGLGASVGYGDLVEQELGIELAKAHTRIDWSRRPLPAGAWEYAADDVRHLLPLASRLRRAVRVAEKEKWAAEDMAELSVPETYMRPPKVQRLRGSRDLSKSRWPLATELTSWREKLAQKADLPRRWVLHDPVLVALATRRPKNRAGLAEIPGLPPRFIERHGDELLRLLSAQHGKPPRQ